jgi:hypothetical protein
MKTRIFALVALVFFAWGCQKEETTESFSLKVSGVENCAPQSFDLTAGMHHVIGSVVVSNADGKLYVTYKSTQPMVEFHLYVFDNASEVTSRRTPGHAHYKSGKLNPAVYEYTFIVELGAWNVCNKQLWLQAHAVTKTGETAYGGDIFKPKKGSWYGNISYMVCCPPPCEPTNETAYGGNSEGSGSAWWYYFNASGPATQAIFAGKKLVEGATVTLADGKIIIVLGDNMLLQASDEAVKILGYMEIPNERPASGSSNPNQIYKGRALEIPVAAYNYYVIHLDARVKNCD